MRRILIYFFFLFISFSYAQNTEYVFVVVIDGARYTETFGEPNHQYIPKIWNELRLQGTIYTDFYNNGATLTNPAHCTILSGT